MTAQETQMKFFTFGLLVGPFRIAGAHSGIFASASDFGSLAGSTVTNTGRSVIDGNLCV
jgi:hypothetical protein